VNNFIQCKACFTKYYVIFVKLILHMLVNRVKDFRKGINLTQEELASKASVSRQTIISIEKNKFVPGLDVAMKISKSLNTPIDKLFYFV
jgi:putative transcriptional regulator